MQRFQGEIHFDFTCDDLDHAKSFLEAYKANLEVMGTIQNLNVTQIGPVKTKKGSSANYESEGQGRT